MTTSPVASAPELDRVTMRLWTAILGSAAAFVAVGSLGWMIAGQSCQDGTPDWGPLSGGVVRLLIGLLAAAGVAVTVSGIAAGHRVWREHRRGVGLAHLEDVAGADRNQFLAVVAMLTSAVFLLGVVWEGLPAVFLEVCEAIR